PKLKLVGRAVIEVPQRDPGGLAAFLAILRMRPFPFGRCPTCRRFFVRVKRQRYCSAPCASQGIEAARKEKKRTYMKTYMRSYRDPREQAKRRRSRERARKNREQRQPAMGAPAGAKKPGSRGR